MTAENLIDESELHLFTTFPQISVLVPTRNYRTSVSKLIAHLNSEFAASRCSWELLFLDDSDDSTPDVIRALQRFNPHVSLLHRKTELRADGLAGAIVNGINASRGQVIAVVSENPQFHTPFVRELSNAVLSGRYELVIASRNISDDPRIGVVKRHLFSKIAVATTHLLVPKTRGVRDPMSDFFVVTRERLTEFEFHPRGTKVLMEILARGDFLRIAEVPFRTDPEVANQYEGLPKESLHSFRQIGALVRARWSAIATIKKILSLLPLTGILAVQFLLSYRLIFHNTAFVDEATYLSAGHYELQTLLHGGPNLYLPTFFSGAPTIYPVLGALAADVGGLHAARLLSLGFMLIATILCYDATRRLWGRPPGWLAAAVFVTTEGTQFLGAFATFDAMSLMLTALAAWLVIKFSISTKTRGFVYLAAPVLVLANATKYASGLFDPIIILLAFFVISHYRDLRQAVRTTAVLLATFCILLFALLAIIPSSYLEGISSTTTNRPPSSDSISLVLHDSWSWVGGIACMALIAAVLAGTMAWKRRRASDWTVAGIIGTLALAVLLAPANQARIHTTYSLDKHVTFGAWFGAVAVGWLFFYVTTLSQRRIWKGVTLASVSLVSLVILASLLSIGIRQARQIDNSWPNSTKIVDALRPLVKDLNRPVLMDFAPIASYYLEDELSLQYWYNTWYFAYTVPGKKTKLLGLPAYRAAVDNGYFSVIALDFSQDIGVDNVVVTAIQKSNRYNYVGDYISTGSAAQQNTYVIWRLKARRK